MPGALTGGPGIFYSKRFDFLLKIKYARLTEVKTSKWLSIISG
jgi:hypothetical protein